MASIRLQLHDVLLLLQGFLRDHRLHATLRALELESGVQLPEDSAVGWTCAVLGGGGTPSNR